jgi:predicted Zn-dependent protease
MREPLEGCHIVTFGPKVRRSTPTATATRTFRVFVSSTFEDLKAERVQIEAKLKSMNLEIVAEIAQIPMSLWQASYSKDQEFEADREGLRIAAAAGYSPQGAVKMTESLAKLDREYVIHAETPTGELSPVAIDGLTGYFRSHPQPLERLEQINEVIAQDHLAQDQPLKPFHIEYEITSGGK